MSGLLELALPFGCGGCGQPGVRWCSACARALDDAPLAVEPRVPVGVPVWAVGRYRGPLAHAVVALKEHRRRDLLDPLGAALRSAAGALHRWGELPLHAGVAAVPAPSRARAAAWRGGEHVTALGGSAFGPARVHPVLALRAGVRDSVGLGVGARERNLAGAVHPRAGAAVSALRAAASAVPVVLIDDVVTTGATAAASVAALRALGVPVAAVLVLAAA